MQASYKRDLNHNYLILTSDNLIDKDSYQVRMLLSSPPGQLLRCSMQMIDSQMFFYYEITAKQSLASIYEHQKLKQKDMQILIGELIRCVEEMQAYLLEAPYLLLKPDYIYLEAEKTHVFFSFFPGEKGDFNNMFRELAEYLLPKIDHTDQAAVTFGYNIYRRAMDNMVYLEQIKEELYQETTTQPKEIVEKLEEDISWEPIITEPEKVTEAWESFFVEDHDRLYPYLSTIAIALTGLLLFGYFYFIKNSRFSWYIYAGVALVLLCLAGGTAVFYLWKIKRKESKHQEIPVMERVEEVPISQELSGHGETTVLSEKPSSIFPCLVGVSPAGLQPVLIKRDVSILGTLESAVHIVLPSTAVSRVHAKMIMEDGYYLCDLNSRNGTYVNHHPIVGAEKYPIQDGDEVKFGDLTYCFKTKNDICC